MTDIAGHTTHVEMYDGRPFCAADYQYDGVDQRDWHADPAAVARTGCMACLQRIVELGAHAAKRQAELIGSAPDRLPETLTAQERACLTYLACGLPNKLIADRMKISDHTAKFHVANVMKKLRAQTRAHAVAIAASLGYVGRRDGLWSV